MRISGFGKFSSAAEARADYARKRRKPATKRKVQKTEDEKKEKRPMPKRKYGKYAYGSKKSKTKDSYTVKEQNAAIFRKLSQFEDLYRAMNMDQFKGMSTAEVFGPTWASATAEQRQNRKAVRFYGQGDYKSFFRGVGRWGSRLGTAIAEGATGYMTGGLSGAAKGLQTGYRRGGEFSKYMGWGDYGPTSTNQLVGQSGSSPMTTSIAVNQSDLTGDVFVTHTEFVQNIQVTIGAGSQSAFEIRNFPINSALSTTFPFLSQLAQNFELYDFQGLMFQYKPTSGESGSAPNNALGKVILATNYDPDAPAFFNSVQMENYDYANSCKPSVGAVHGVETAPQSSHIDLLYTRTGQSTKALSFTDIGNFFFATEGIPGSPGDIVQIGELWVSYRVRLSRANLFVSLLGRNITTSRYQWTAADVAVLNPFDPAVTDFEEFPQNQIDMRLEPVVGFTNQLFVEFPPNISLGGFRISVWCQSITAPPLDWEMDDPISLVNCSLYRPAQAGGGAFASNVPGAGASSGIIQNFYLQVDSPGTSQASFILVCDPATQVGITAGQYILFIERCNLDFNQTFAPVPFANPV